jgi:hypothetical protein
VIEHAAQVPPHRRLARQTRPFAERVCPPLPDLPFGATGSLPVNAQRRWGQEATSTLTWINLLPRERICGLVAHGELQSMRMAPLKRLASAAQTKYAPGSDRTLMANVILTTLVGSELMI